MAGIVLVALALRLVGLAWGSPFVYHLDEWRIASPAMSMVQAGSWNPNTFVYPTALIYIERFLVSIFHWADPTVSLSSGRVALPEQFTFYFAGRAFVAVCGAVMVIPTFLAARAVSNTAGGIAAAVAIAVAPLAVANSHYLTTDVPVATLSIVTLWLSLRGMGGGRRWLVAAGFAAGVAASTKYNGGLVVIVPLVVLLTSCPPRQLLQRSNLATAGLIVLASIAGFVLFTPAILFDPWGVINGGILYQVREYSGGHPGEQGSDNSIYFLRVLFGPNGLGPGLSILAAAGLLTAVVRHRRGDLAVLAFAIPYYAMIALPPVRFDRNLLPLLPFVAVLAGLAVGMMVDVAATRLRQPAGDRRPMGRSSPTVWPGLAVGLAVIAVAATPSIGAAIAGDRLLLAPDTRTIALGWIEQHIPPGSTVARELSTPQVPDPPYEVLLLNPLPSEPLEWYRSSGVDYVVVSGSEMEKYSHDASDAAFYRALLAQPVVLDLQPQPDQQGPEVIVVELRTPALDARGPSPAGARSDHTARLPGALNSGGRLGFESPRCAGPSGA